MKYLRILALLCAGSLSAWAHQPDLATIIISKTNDGKIVMQINSSLTAFQREVNYHNPENAYKTPEEFQNLVIEHFYDTFTIIINENDTLSFVNPIVVLGHETKLVAELKGMPEAVNAVYIKSNFFKDIHNNEAFIVSSLAEFSTKKNFVLNNENEHTLNVYLKDGIWQHKDENALSSFLNPLFYALAALLIILLFFFLLKVYSKTKVKA